MTAKQERRWLALVAMAKLPDEPKLVGLLYGQPRGYRYTLARHPDGACSQTCERRDAKGMVISSNPDILKRDLGTAYVAWRRQEHKEGDISCVVSVRRWPRLKVVRRA